MQAIASPVLTEDMMGAGPVQVSKHHDVNTGQERESCTDGLNSLPAWKPEVVDTVLDD